MDPIVYEHLLSLNRNVSAAINTLRKLAEYPELKRDGFLITSSYFQEHLSDANVSILEALHESEEMAGGIACKERGAYEKLIRDPDDCYLEVMQREKERQEQGLPSLIGIQYGPRNVTNEMLSDGDRKPGATIRTRRKRALKVSIASEQVPCRKNTEMIAGRVSSLVWRLSALNN